MQHRKQIILSLGLLVALTLSTGCGEKIQPGTSHNGEARTIKAPVAVARVTQQPFLYEAVATVTAQTASTISSKLMGTVKVVHVNEGDRVKTGDLLVTLDQRQVSAQLDQTQAAVKEARRTEASAESARESARATAQLATSTYQRYVRLLKEHSVSQQEFEEVEARHREAQAALNQTKAMLAAAQFRVQQAEAAVASATVSKKDALVRAPYDGKIVAKMVDQGDLASPGTPFVTIEKEGLFCADLVLPERHIQSVDLGLQVEVVIPALQDVHLTGTIGRIVPAADERSRSFMIKVQLPEDPRIRSGMFARVLIPVGSAGMLLLPQLAIKAEGQLDGVFIIDEEQFARFRLVRLGKQFGDSVEILSGLTSGERYVVVPPLELRNGDKVEVTS